MITCGGPMMTKDCEVLNSDGLVIEGVYMAGEIVGMANVGGRNSIGGMGHGQLPCLGQEGCGSDRGEARQVISLSPCG